MNVAFLTGTASAVDVGSIVSSITGSLSAFTTDNLLTILGAGIGVAAGLVITWFGFNFLVRKASGALKKGKL